MRLLFGLFFVLMAVCYCGMAFASCAVSYETEFESDEPETIRVCAEVDQMILIQDEEEFCNQTEMPDLCQPLCTHLIDGEYVDLPCEVENESQEN